MALTAACYLANKLVVLGYVAGVAVGHSSRIVGSASLVPGVADLACCDAPVVHDEALVHYK